MGQISELYTKRCLINAMEKLAGLFDPYGIQVKIDTEMFEMLYEMNIAREISRDRKLSLALTKDRKFIFGSNPAIVDWNIRFFSPDVLIGWEQLTHFIDDPRARNHWRG